ncbi:hypothetical protein JZ751_006292 [Albula glossodonta]|uniref:Pre-mRNA-splicing factor 38B n=1 Tax=Albula glossodonta TaxID=121402 RepID=A0A8T2MQ42_9TELE|nr:hypothetical protein JZ751_006292 [Albula glossodonta]
MYIYNKAKPGSGGIVSTAFCLLYKLFTLKPTRKQVIGLITHTDSPYMRAFGFMYIRQVKEGRGGLLVPLQAGQPLKFTVLETLDRNKEEFEFLQAQYHRFLMQSDKHPHTG